MIPWHQLRQRSKWFFVYGNLDEFEPDPHRLNYTKRNMLNMLNTSADNKLVSQIDSGHPKDITKPVFNLMERFSKELKDGLIKSRSGEANIHIPYFNIGQKYLLLELEHGTEDDYNVYLRLESPSPEFIGLVARENDYGYDYLQEALNEFGPRDIDELNKFVAEFQGTEQKHNFYRAVVSVMNSQYHNNNIELEEKLAK